MSKKEERYIIIGVVIAILSGVAGWLAIPQVQQLFNSDVNGVPATLNLDGIWRGRTSEGGQIVFEVNEMVITFGIIDFVTRKKSDSAPCPPSGGFGHRQAYIESNAFTKTIETTYLNIEIGGVFASDTEASGTIIPPGEPFSNDVCDVIYSTWTAEKQ